MGRPPYPESTTRKSITLPDRQWNAINDQRKLSPGRVPSEADMIRTLIAEALAARQQAVPEPDKRPKRR